METKVPLLEVPHVLRVSCCIKPFLKSLNATRFICIVLSVFKLQTFYLPFSATADFKKKIKMYWKPKEVTCSCLVCHACQSFHVVSYWSYQVRMMLV